MQRRIPRRLAMLVLVSAFPAVSAEGPPALPTVPGTDEVSCRKLVSPPKDAGKVLCGTSAQWSEFDRRVARLNRRAGGNADALRMIDEARNSAQAYSAPVLTMEATQRLQQ